MHNNLSLLYFSVKLSKCQGYKCCQLNIHKMLIDWEHAMCIQMHPHVFNTWIAFVEATLVLKPLERKKILQQTPFSYQTVSYKNRSCCNKTHWCAIRTLWYSRVCWQTKFSKEIFLGNLNARQSTNQISCA